MVEVEGYGGNHGGVVGAIGELGHDDADAATGKFAFELRDDTGQLLQRKTNPSAPAGEDGQATDGSINTSDINIIYQADNYYKGTADCTVAY